MPKSRIQTLENENARLIAAAAAESLRVEAFLREISHDLRNSLSSVLTASEVLLALNSSPDLTPILQSIQRQANVIAQIAARMMAAYETTDTPVSLPLATSLPSKLSATPANVDKSHVEHRPLRILAIDDRRDALLPLRVLLTKEGHEVAVAIDGVSGLASMATFHPEIVLCDINLPGELSGLDVARRIRLQSKRDSIYVVAISGSSQAGDLENSAKAGFDFHIAKPITITALRSLIDKRPRFKVEG